MVEEIKTNKNTRILMLYSALINGQVINKFTYSMEHNINERTFERDIAEIRNYLSEIYSPCELLYDKINDFYYLSGVVPKYIDKMDATVIAKILLDSSTLRKDELKGLLEKIMLNVNPYEVNEIITYLKNDINFYESLTEISILKILTDLYMVIDKGNDLEITDDEGKNLIISPIRILIENSKFILLANVENSLLDYIKIDVEKISSFKILKTLNAKIIQQNYYTEREE